MSDMICGTMLLRLPREHALRLLQNSLELKAQQQGQMTSTELTTPEPCTSTSTPSEIIAIDFEKL